MGVVNAFIAGWML